ncbi:MAG: uncharacterized metal-binding protein YceD (DUF177 family) [Polyangiales bacterium]|jgi:uncharacterized metal-binding protein YceD (DUF177 family)
MARFILTIPEIETAGGSLEKSFVLDTAWLRGAVEGTEFTAPDDQSEPFHIVARQIMEDVIVEGRFRAVLGGTCARCSEPLPITMDGNFTQLFTNRTQTDLPEELELTPEDLERETFAGERIELDAAVREFILLEVPMSPKCEGGCADPIINQILGLDDTGNPLPEGKPAGPLAALADLAAKMKKGES